MLGYLINKLNNFYEWVTVPRKRKNDERNIIAEHYKTYATPADDSDSEYGDECNQKKIRLDSIQLQVPSDSYTRNRMEQVTEDRSRFQKRHNGQNEVIVRRPHEQSIVEFHPNQCTPQERCIGAGARPKIPNTRFSNGYDHFAGGSDEVMLICETNQNTNIVIHSNTSNIRQGPGNRRHQNTKFITRSKNTTVQTVAYKRPQSNYRNSDCKGSVESKPIPMGNSNYDKNYGSSSQAGAICTAPSPPREPLLPRPSNYFENQSIQSMLCGIGPILESLAVSQRNHYDENVCSRTPHINIPRQRPSNLVIRSDIVYSAEATAKKSQEIQATCNLQNQHAPAAVEEIIISSHNGSALGSVDKICVAARNKQMENRPSPRLWSTSKECQPDYVKNICSKFQERKLERDKRIAEESLNKAGFALKLSQYHERKETFHDMLPSHLQDVVIEEFVLPEEPEEIPEFTPEMEEVVNFKLENKNQNTIIVQTRGIEIRVVDVGTLVDGRWLNDAVINSYLELINSRGKQEGYPKVHCFSTFFYGKLESAGFSGVSRWTKKVDIFAEDLLIFPVHLAIHWCLAVIDFRHKTIKYYDSMGGANQRCLKVLWTYLNSESEHKKQKPYSMDGWTAKNFSKTEIPQQQNGSDCGMFTLKFAEYISRDATISFTQDDMPLFRKLMMYELLSVHLLAQI